MVLTEAGFARAGALLGVPLDNPRSTCSSARCTWRSTPKRCCIATATTWCATAASRSSTSGPGGSRTTAAGRTASSQPSKPRKRRDPRGRARPRVDPDAAFRPAVPAPGRHDGDRGARRRGVRRVLRPRPVFPAASKPAAGSTSRTSCSPAGLPRGRDRQRNRPRARTGRPILVGTTSVRESEELGGRLRPRGMPCRILNAKQDAHEARIVGGCRTARRGHDLDEHGRARHRHRPRGRGRRGTRRRRGYRRAIRASAPTVTRAGGSTISCAVAPGARATPARHASSSASRTT